MGPPPGVWLAFPGRILPGLCSPLPGSHSQDYAAPSSRLERGQDTVWPLVKGRKGETVDLSQIPPPEVRSHDMAYLYDLEDGWYALVNSSRGVGFGLRWDKSLFPHLWFWQLYRGGMGYPWFGTNYTAALEPVSSYPQTLTEAIKAKTQLVLAAGGERRTRLVAAAFAGSIKVKCLPAVTGATVFGRATEEVTHAQAELATRE